MSQFNHISIMKLMKLLTGSKVDSKTIQQAIRLICEEFSLSGCFVYEPDVSGKLRLEETFSYEETIESRAFLIDNATVQQQAELREEALVQIIRKEDNLPFEALLLEFYKGNSVVLSAVRDEHGMVNGIIVLVKQTGSVPEEELPIVETYLAILGNHLLIRMYQRQLEQSKLTLDSVLDNTGIDIYVNDFYSHDILYVNESMAAPYGGKAAFFGRKCWQVLFPGQDGPCEFCPQKKLIDEQGEPTNVYSWDYQRAFDGSWFRVFSASFRWVDGRMAHIVSSANITDNKRNEALIENLANYDQLTKLPNRRMLIRECENRINHATALEQGYLLFFDIDNFKYINDTFGHDAGDDFLVQLGEFFTQIPMLKDSIYRNGGDEFVAIIGGETITKDHIRNLASFIHERFKKPWVLKQGTVYSNTSIGVACYPEDGVTADELLQKADMAMYQVKRAGGKGICFGYEMK